MRNLLIALIAAAALVVVWVLFSKNKPVVSGKGEIPGERKPVPMSIIPMKIDPTKPLSLQSLASQRLSAIDWGSFLEKDAAGNWVKKPLLGVEKSPDDNKIQLGVLGNKIGV